MRAVKESKFHTFIVALTENGHACMMFVYFFVSLNTKSMKFDDFEPAK